MKLKRYHKIMITFLLIALFLFQIISFIGTAVSASESEITKFAIQTSMGEKPEYLTGQQAFIDVLIDMSDAENVIANPTVTVTMPSKFTPSINPSDMSSQISKTIDNQNGTITITYKFTQLTGGTTMSIPIIIDNTPYDTPDGYVLPITAKLYDSEGMLIADAEPLSLIYTITKFSGHKGILDKDNIIYYGGGTYTAYGGPAPDIISTDDSVSTDDSISSNLDLISTDDSVPVTFYFFAESYSRTSRADLGGRKVSGFVITDTIPEGAVFLESDNPNWIYDPETRTAKYTSSQKITLYGNAALSRYGAALKLRFPGQNTIDTYTNFNTITFIPDNKSENESEITVDGKVNFKLTNVEPIRSPIWISKSANISTVYDYLKSKKQDIQWYLSVSNYGTNHFENMVITDYNLDSRLKYTSIDILGETGNFSGTVTIEAINANGITTKIASKVALNESRTFNIPEGTARIVIKSDSGSYLLSNKTVRFTIHSSFIDAENTHTSAVEYMWSYMDVTGNYSGEDTVKFTANAYAYVIFHAYNPRAQISKTVHRENVLVNNVIDYSLLVKTHSDYAPLHADDYIDAQAIVDLLPLGFDYVQSSASAAYAQGCKDALSSEEPEIVRNFKGTGRTALIWRFVKALAGNQSSFDSLGSGYLRINYSVQVTIQAESGVNENHAYFVYANNASSSDGINFVVLPFNGVEDEMDLNNNGDLSELFSSASSQITYIPPKEVITTKFVKGCLDSNYTVMPGYGRTEIDDDIKYNIKIANYSPLDSTDLTVVDVLPYKDDQTLVVDNDGNYKNRNSQYNVLLAGPAEIPEGYTAYYTTTLPAADMSTYVSSANWVTSMTDYSLAKGIKIVLNSGNVLKNNSVVSFHLPCKSDADISLQDGDMSYNSTAISLNNIDYFEATKIGARIYKYKIRGIVFKDIDRSGIYDDGDGVFANHKVLLVDLDGNPVEDPAGNPIEAVTDSNGKYTMTVYRSGEYKIKVLNPEHYNLTTYVPNASDIIGSNIIEGGTISDVIKIGPDILEAEVNAGYHTDWQPETSEPTVPGSTESSTESITESGTEDSTESITENRTDSSTESVTESRTDSSTESVTEGKTDSTESNESGTKNSIEDSEEISVNEQNNTAVKNGTGGGSQGYPQSPKTSDENNVTKYLCLILGSGLILFLYKTKRFYLNKRGE